jgi:hypothetical protein
VTDFALVHACALVLIWLGMLDVDRGGYVDSFRTRDKLWHALGGFLVCAEGVLVFHLPVLPAIISTVVVGTLFECVQRWPRDGGPGFLSWRDIVADTAGAELFALLYLACT